MDSMYKALTEFESSGLLLRDFFIASDSRSLKSAYLSLNQAASALKEEEWLAVEYDFNALFVGPGKLKAAPYASVYLEEAGLVMGKTTLDLREFMEQLGLSLNKENNIPDDHISCVLELAVLLSVNARQSAEYTEAFIHYVNEYVLSWVPAYREKIKINAQTAPLRHVAETLSDWLDELKTRVSI